MSPSPIQVFWSGLKNGLFIWPFETSPGTYFALPLYVVIPVLLVLAGAIGVVLMSNKSRKL